MRLFTCMFHGSKYNQETPLGLTQICLLPSGSEKHEVLLFGSI